MTLEERLLYSYLQSEFWELDAHAELRVYGISGEVANAISFALDWHRRVYGGNGLFTSRRGYVQAKVGKKRILIISTGWCDQPPKWLVGQVERYLHAHKRNIGLNLPGKIKLLLRRAYDQWMLSQERRVPRRKANRHLSLVG